MPVAARMLVVSEESLRHDEVEMIFRPRHSDVKNPPLLIDLGLGPGAQITGDAAITVLRMKTDFHSWPLAE